MDSENTAYASGFAVIWSNGVALPSSAGTESPVRTQSSRRDHDSQTRSPMSSAQARTESRVSDRRQLPSSVSSKRPSSVVVHSSRATRPRSRRCSAPGFAPTAAARSSLLLGPAAIASARPRAAAVWIACGTHRLEIMRESRNGVGTAAGVCWVMSLPPPAREDSNEVRTGLGEKSGPGRPGRAPGLSPCRRPIRPSGRPSGRLSGRASGGRPRRRVPRVPSAREGSTASPVAPRRAS